MISRTLTEYLRNQSRKFPLVSVTGPRQSGKTTLLRATFPDYSYVSLETPDSRDFAESDPRGFLSRYPGRCILDEVQRTPMLFSYLQQAVDEKKEKGMYLLSGSQQFLLSERIAQSLAGRVAVLNLLPLSIEELSGRKSPLFSLDDLILTGGYPRLYDAQISPGDYFPSYLATYIERDVRLLKNITNLSLFQRFLKLCAGRTGSILNLHALGNDCGISHNTARAWMSVLETSFVTFLLSPYHVNLKKRLVKSPKLYFYDTGVACSLLGIHTTQELAVHPMRGSLFENLIITEYLKHRFHHGKRPDLHFWRDKTGNEVDCIIESGREITPVEIKAGQTIGDDFFKGIRYFNRLRGGKRGFVIYGGSDIQHRTDAVVLGWKNCLEALKE